MKTVTKYEIREFTNQSAYSRPMSVKLRSRNNATRLVKRLKKLGHDAFAVPFKIAV